MISKFHLSLALILLLFMVGSASAEEKVCTQSFVIFNTKCANCHEGQCSSRMCFQMEASDATVHIRRYAGEVADSVVRELYRALQHMKTKCAYYPSPAKVPNDGKWSKSDILLLSLSSRKGSFIPLGKLKAIKYTIHFVFEEPREFRIEILSQHFEPLVDERFVKPSKEMTVSFAVEKASEHYLRIRSKKALIITGLQLNIEPE